VMEKAPLTLSVPLLRPRLAFRSAVTGMKRPLADEKPETPSTGLRRRGNKPPTLNNQRVSSVSKSRRRHLVIGLRGAAVLRGECLKPRRSQARSDQGTANLPTVENRPCYVSRQLVSRQCQRLEALPADVFSFLGECSRELGTFCARVRQVAITNFKKKYFSYTFRKMLAVSKALSYSGMGFS
jgi:hypothetical protein